MKIYPFFIGKRGNFVYNRYMVKEGIAHVL